jgi:hypothetical protein
MTTIKLASNTIIDKSQIAACQSIITNDKTKMYLIYECAVEEYYYNSENDMYVFNNEIDINEVPYYNLIINLVINHENDIELDWYDSILIEGNNSEELALKIKKIKLELDKIIDGKYDWDIENLHGENLPELENEIKKFL